MLGGGSSDTADEALLSADSLGMTADSAAAAAEQVVGTTNITVATTNITVACGDTSVVARANQPVEIQTDTVKETITKPVAKKATAPVQAAAPSAGHHKLPYGSWTGGWKNGQPHGSGTMTYSTSHTIDTRDPKQRVAQPREYVVGEWDNGHLVQGRWFKNDGSKEAIIIGKAG